MKIGKLKEEKCDWDFECKDECVKIFGIWVWTTSQL